MNIEVIILEKQFDNRFFVDQYSEDKIHPWKNYPNEVSIHTFIRNQIHHRSENGEPSYDSLKYSISKMRELIIISITELEEV